MRFTDRFLTGEIEKSFKNKVVIDVHNPGIISGSSILEDRFGLSGNDV
jgi:hypothetical protein